MKVTLGDHPKMARILDELGELYTDLGVEVKQLKSYSTDAVFHRDVMAWTPFGLIKCRMGKASRQWEPDAWFEATRLRPALTIQAPGTFEGADLLLVGSGLALVGVGQRTNADGAAQVVAWLGEHGLPGRVLPLPHYHDQHLLGVANVIGEMVYSYGMRGLICLGLPSAEYPYKAVNWVQVDNSLVMPSGCPLTKVIVSRGGVEVITLRIGELLDHGGGVACATGIYAY